MSTSSIAVAKDAIIDALLITFIGKSEPEHKALIPRREDIMLGHWDCRESPTDKCAYDVTCDIACDHCLFCGLPDERK